jgi:hypothetical protein
MRPALDGRVDESKRLFGENRGSPRSLALGRRALLKLMFAALIPPAEPGGAWWSPSSKSGNSERLCDSEIMDRSVGAAARHQRLLWLLAVFFVGAACLCWFFRPVIVSNFRFLLGELGDTRFNNAILEHWWTFWRAGRDWKSPPMFFPEPGVLAFSDALFMFTPFYGLARLSGLTPYYALGAMVACLLLFGYLLTLWLLCRVFGIAPWVALLGAAIYAFGGMRIRHYGHVQLFAGLFLPLLLGAAVLYLEQLALRGFGLRQGLLLAIGVAGLLLTSFYVAWFFILFLALTALCFVLVDAAQRGPIAVRALLNRRSGASLSLVGAVLILALLPFLALYLPRFAEFGSRPWVEVAKILPTVVDLINVGDGNPVWGAIVQRLVPGRGEYELELSFGLPIALMGVFLVTSVVLLLFPKKRWLGNINAHPRAKLLSALALAVILVWLLMIVWEGQSLWRVAYRLVPGGAAIRAVFRFQVVLYLGVVVVSMCGLSQLWRTSTRRLAPRIFLVCLSALLVIEQIERNPPVFDARAETARIQSIQPPPAFCRHFALFGDGTYRRGPWEVNIDAVMIALRTGLPTANGYSGNFPRGWGLHDPISIGYESAVVEWAARHDIEQGLCALTATSGIWRRVIPIDSDDLTGKNLVTLTSGRPEDSPTFKRRGFHDLEAGGRWTDGLGVVSFATPLTARQVRIAGMQYNPLGGAVRILVNGRLRYSQTLPHAPFDIVVLVDESVKEIQIDSATFVPSLLGINQDRRQLGILVKELVIE